MPKKLQTEKMEVLRRVIHRRRRRFTKTASSRACYVCKRINGRVSLSQEKPQDP